MAGGMAGRSARARLLSHSLNAAVAQTHPGSPLRSPSSYDARIFLQRLCGENGGKKRKKRRNAGLDFDTKTVAWPSTGCWESCSAGRQKRPLCRAGN